MGRLTQDENYTIKFDTLLTELTDSIIVVDCIFADRCSLRRKYLSCKPLSDEALQCKSQLLALEGKHMSLTAMVLDTLKIRMQGKMEILISTILSV